MKKAKLTRTAKKKLKAATIMPIKTDIRRKAKEDGHDLRDDVLGDYITSILYLRTIPRTCYEDKKSSSVSNGN